MHASYARQLCTLIVGLNTACFLLSFCPSLIQMHGVSTHQLLIQAQTHVDRINQLLPHARSCLREVRAAQAESKPLCLVHESNPDRNGAALDKLTADCPSDIRAFVFGERPVLPWLPLHDFQMVTLMSIAETTLLHCRAYAGRTELPLKLIDDVRDQPLELQKSVVIYSSPANTGANELEGVMRKQIIEDDAQILAKSRRSRVGKSSFGRSRRVSTERRAAFEWVESDLGTATHFLLYLNKKTFDANADALVTDIHDALAQGKPVLLIHENNESLDGVPFATILGATPQSLIDAQLYESLVIPWHPPGDAAPLPDCTPIAWDCLRSWHSPGAARVTDPAKDFFLLEMADGRAAHRGYS